MRLIMLAILLFLGSPNLFAQQDDGQKKNKLVEFKGFGEWEIWCIDIKQSGNIECNLNQVSTYKYHPDFRAIILRFYSDGNNFIKLTLDLEWQTSLSRGFIQIDQLPPLSFGDCDKPCVVEDELVARITEQFTSGNKAVIRIHDYVVQEFNIDIVLDQFASAAEALHILSRKYQ